MERVADETASLPIRSAEPQQRVVTDEGRTSRRNHIGFSARRVVHRGRKMTKTRLNVTRLNASALKGVAVESRHGSGGRLRDLIICPSEIGDAEILALVVRCDRHDVRIDAASLTERSASGALVVSIEPVDQPVFERRSGELLVFRDLFDAEVIDRPAQRIIRVNDAVIEWDGTHLVCAAIDASVAGLFRRLAPRRFADRFKGSTVPWDEIEPTIEPPPGLDFGFSYAGLQALHPADIAKLIDHLPYRQGARILCSLEAQLAADTLEEVERRRQPEILEYLPRDRALTILNGMAPDAAADLLELVPQDKSDALIALLEPEVSSDIRLLLSYPHNSAAGLMTTDFVTALEDETIEEALTYVRGQLRQPDLVYYVYIVDNPTDRRLQGVMSLRDLLLADPGSVLRDCMGSTIHTVHPEEHCKEVARIMGEYNLLALPVIDDTGRMLGLVKADDVLDLMLPDSMRQHLPRLFI